QVGERSRQRALAASRNGIVKGFGRERLAYRGPRQAATRRAGAQGSAAALAAYPGGHRHRPWPLSIAAAPRQSAGRRGGSPDSSSLRRNHGCGALWFSSQVAHPRDCSARRKGHGGRSGGEAWAAWYPKETALAAGGRATELSQSPPASVRECLRERTYDAA